MTIEELKAELGLNEPREYLRRTLPTGRVAVAIPLTLGRARVCLFDAGSEVCYQDQW